MKYMNFNSKIFVGLVRYPLFTKKSIKLIEQNQYSFVVSTHATKASIKSAVEYQFGFNVISVNTLVHRSKKHHVGKFIGKKPQYKKAIVTIVPPKTLSFFDIL